MILYDNAVEETGSHIAHKVTTLSCKAMPRTMYTCRPVNAVFKTPPVLAPELVLENTSSLQSAGSQVSVLYVKSFKEVKFCCFHYYENLFILLSRKLSVEHGNYCK